MGLGHCQLACSFRFFNFLLIKLCHGVVLFHPAFVFQLTLIFVEVESFRPFLHFLLVSKLKLDLLQRYVLSQLLNLKLQLHLNNFYLPLSLDAPLTSQTH
jgi:hypothetical protein